MKTASRSKAGGNVVPMRSSALRATAAWATAEAGTVRLSCEPAGAFTAVADGVKTPLPCEWVSAKDEGDSREIVLDGRAALAEAGDAAKLTLTFEPDDGGSAIEESAEIRAYELKVEAVSDWPSNRVRHVFGPLEEVKLSVESTPSSVNWYIEGTTGDEETFPWTAYFKPTKDEGRVKVDGATLDFTLETIAPQRLKAVEYHPATDYDWIMAQFDAPEEGMIGVGLVVSDLRLEPDWVSFTNVDIKEGFCLATNMVGVFDFDGAQAVLPPHGSEAGAENVIDIHGSNCIGDDIAAIVFGNIDQPWRESSFRYDIPLYWRVRRDPFSDLWHSFGTESQIFTFHSNGDLTVEKFGVAVTRGTNGVARITKESKQ